MKVFMFLVVLFVSFTVNGQAAPLQCLDNGHYYEAIIQLPYSPLSWFDAIDVSESLIYNGLSGHLATITSSDENNFIQTNFFTGNESNFAWIGGKEVGDNGAWFWATGPEKDVQFSNFKTPMAPYNYANWGGIEPNDNNPQEDYLMYNIGNKFAGISPGQWADAEPWASGYDPVVGYIVEYEPSSVVPEPATLSLLGLGLLGLALRKRN